MQVIFQNQPLIKITDIRDRSFISVKLLTQALRKLQAQQKVRPLSMKWINCIYYDELPLLIRQLRDEIIADTGHFNHPSQPAFKIATSSGQMPNDELYALVQKELQNNNIIICPVDEFISMTKFQGKEDRNTIENFIDTHAVFTDKNGHLRPKALLRVQGKPDIFVHKGVEKELLNARASNYQGQISLFKINERSRIPVAFLMQALKSARQKQSLSPPAQASLNNFILPTELPALFNEVRHQIITESGEYNHPERPVFKFIQPTGSTLVKDDVYAQIQNALKQARIILCSSADFIPLTDFRSKKDQKAIQKIASLHDVFIDENGALWPKVLKDDRHTMVHKSVKNEVQSTRDTVNIKNMITMHAIAIRSKISEKFLMHVLQTSRENGTILPPPNERWNKAITRDELPILFTQMQDAILNGYGDFDFQRKLVLKVPAFDNGTPSPKDDLYNDIRNAMKAHYIFVRPKEDFIIDEKQNAFPKENDPQTALWRKQIIPVIKNFIAHPKHSLLALSIIRKYSLIPAAYLSLAFKKAKKAGAISDLKFWGVSNRVLRNDLPALFRQVKQEIFHKNGHYKHPSDPAFVLHRMHLNSALKDNIYLEISDSIRQANIILCPDDEYKPITKINTEGVRDIARKLIEKSTPFVTKDGHLRPQVIGGKDVVSNAFIHKEVDIQPLIYKDYIQLFTIAKETKIKISLLEMALSCALDQKAWNSAPSEKLTFAVHKDNLQLFFKYVHDEIIKKTGTFNHPLNPAFAIVNMDKSPIKETDNNKDIFTALRQNNIFYVDRRQMVPISYLPAKDMKDKSYQISPDQVMTEQNGNIVPKRLTYQTPKGPMDFIHKSIALQFIRSAGLPEKIDTSQRIPLNPSLQKTRE